MKEASELHSQVPAKRRLWSISLPPRHPVPGGTDVLDY